MDVTDVGENLCMVESGTNLSVNETAEDITISNGQSLVILSEPKLCLNLSLETSKRYPNELNERMKHGFL